MRTIQRQIVSALIYSKEGKLLMGKKDPKLGGVYIDCWHIPGGGIEENEDKIQALIREVKEEVGIDILPYKIELADDKDFGTSEKTLPDGEKVLVEMHFNVYKIAISDKNSEEISVVLSDDLAEYNWFTIPELSTIKPTPPSVRLFEKLGYIK